MAPYSTKREGVDDDDEYIVSETNKNFKFDSDRKLHR